jgi:hypothetical protein
MRESISGKSHSAGNSDEIGEFRMTSTAWVRFVGLMIWASSIQQCKFGTLTPLLCKDLR